MKKRILAILACVLMLINVFSFSACDNGELNAKIAELEAKIEQQQEKIEELEEQISQSAAGDKFYSLMDAYEKNWLTKENLMSIAYYHNGGRRDNEEIMPEDYAPQPKNPAALSEETELEIKQAQAKMLNDESILAENIKVRYYGTYNGSIAFMPILPGPYNDVESEINYNGVNIIYTSSHSKYNGFIAIYK